jgi:hypothetical protein
MDRQQWMSNEDFGNFPIISCQHQQEEIVHSSHHLQMELACHGKIKFEALHSWYLE